MIRKILILSITLVALMAGPAAAQYGTTTTAPGVGPNTANTSDQGGVGANNGNQGSTAGTGTNADDLVRIGGVLLLGGGALTLFAGKRRRRSPST